MFTGIIEELGVVKSIAINGASGCITIKAKKVLEGTQLGDSIAVNGTCLTVTSINSDGFSADVMAETVKRTSLSQVGKGDLVNLERAMILNGRFGGHIVSGHIDGTGTITKYTKEENAIWVTIKAPDEILDLIVEKGSICIDGISLTVATVSDQDFQVSIIPHTAKETTLIHKKVGSLVNLENDIVGKYIKKLMENNQEEQAKKASGLTMEMLEEYGL
ncbi:MAG: riboflavin synthase [Roseburia inulinivorans]|uniref:Riboflavin synthase n=1 Tax=Roseburia inulinivorans TaxID=360807 RepID=A0A1Q6TCA5_9FIRM|nr:riboflavin synthase [Roseburia inulinivorans]MBS5096029.1 riboflavin synthase [Roseburia sp.]MBS6241824.1 riboflavin synthase [Roseburia sp.]MBS6959390.1 riboflavin synthase [Roseburia sp.]OLA68882.1 MAG: riboflavin synthase subunit alpha [Roseburia inulinivorans]RHD06694.1 riboflavin synthase [Roseburia inulinivorans]